MKKLRSRKVLALLALVLLCFGCKKQQCGLWAFSGSVATIDGVLKFPMSNSFTFTPADCGSNCVVDQDAIIQMVVIFDTKAQTYRYASSQSQAPYRLGTDGWVIDQLDGWAYAYYGQLNDGTFDAFWNNAGSNNTATILNDVPGGFGPNTVFYAIDVPVSYQSKTCANAPLGYYFWSWTEDNNGVMRAGINTTAWQGMDTEFQNAVNAWNAWAPGSGPESSDGITTAAFDHAVLIPTLTSL